MRKLFSSSNAGRVGLAVGVLALVAGTTGAAVGLPGRNSVDSGDIKNGAVTVQDLKIAFVRVNATGGVSGKGIKGVDKPVPNVICLDLAFVPKTGNATRAADSGGDFTAPQIGLPPLAAQVGCQAPFTDALVQVPGQPDLNGTYAQFFG